MQVLRFGEDIISGEVVHLEQINLGLRVFLLQDSDKGRGSFERDPEYCRGTLGNAMDHGKISHLNGTAHLRLFDARDFGPPSR